MNNLAKVLKNLNKLYQSENLYRDLLRFQKINIQANDPNIGNSLNNLAEVLKSQNKFKQSELLYREAIDFRKANL